MIYNYIKIISLSILIIGITIASFTDIKYLTVSNKLTSIMFTAGIILGSIFYLNYPIIHLIFYYLSILGIFIIVYILWKMGLWAGGDVKLFTATSTLFCIDYLDIIPKIQINNIILPYYGSISYIPTLTLILNSVFAILPIILIIVIYDIVKNKHHLIKSLFKKSDINSLIISLNTLNIYYIINSLYPIHVMILNLIFFIIISALNREISKRNKMLFNIITLLLLGFIIYYNLIILYLIELIGLFIIIIIKNIIKKNLIKEILSYEVNVNNLEESMILANNLVCENDKYFFDNQYLKDRLLNSDEYKIIVNQNAGGLTLEDIILLKRLEEKNYINDKIKIKKSLPFVPFILVGLIITLTLGDTFALIKILLEAIL